MQRVCACIETVYDVYKVQKRGKQVYSQCMRRATVADRFSARAGAAEKRRQAERKELADEFRGSRSRSGSNIHIKPEAHLRFR